jgi:hypothetical protein
MSQHKDGKTLVMIEIFGGTGDYRFCPCYYLEPCDNSHSQNHMQAKN